MPATTIIEQLCTSSFALSQISRDIYFDANVVLCYRLYFANMAKVHILLEILLDNELTPCVNIAGFPVSIISSNSSLVVDLPAKKEAYFNIRLLFVADWQLDSGKRRVRNFFKKSKPADLLYLSVR